ncbi:MAG: flavodoxin domain-containing protein [Anaerolineae bacterium]
MMNILVTYASKHNATAEIAGVISDELRTAGFPVVSMPVSQVKDLTAYDVVVLGSAVYMGNWMAEAASFLKANETDLATRHVWLFSSGPTGEGDPNELMKGWNFPESLEDVADRVGPYQVKLFGGRVDFSTLNWGERAILRMVKPPRGDFRDWDDIHAWAQHIAAVLNRMATPEPNN